MKRLNCFGACASHYSDYTLQLQKINEEANQINIWLASFRIYITFLELS